MNGEKSRWHHLWDRSSLGISFTGEENSGQTLQNAMGINDSYRPKIPMGEGGTEREEPLRRSGGGRLIGAVG